MFSFLLRKYLNEIAIQRTAICHALSLTCVPSIRSPLQLNLRLSCSRDEGKFKKRRGFIYPLQVADSHHSRNRGFDQLLCVDVGLYDLTSSVVSIDLQTILCLISHPCLPMMLSPLAIDVLGFLFIIPLTLCQTNIVGPGYPLWPCAPDSLT